MIVSLNREMNIKQFRLLVSYRQKKKLYNGLKCYNRAVPIPLIRDSKQRENPFNNQHYYYLTRVKYESYESLATRVESTF